MGFGAIIAAAFGLFLIILTAYMVLDGISSLSYSLADSIKKIQDEKNEQLKTSLKMESTKKEGDYVYLNLSNTGSSKIREFQLMDVIVINTTTKNSSYLRYNNTLSQEEWNYTLYKDHINPGILDPGEGMNISAYVNKTIDPNIAWIATPNGIVVSSYLE